MTAPLQVPGLPGGWNWLHAPVSWTADPDGTLSITAGPGTDWFADPAGSPSIDNAPVLLTADPATPFMLKARIGATFRHPFDAGVIQLRTTPGNGAKFCHEFSAARRPTVVSVVTHGKSDDANGEEAPPGPLWMRVSVAHGTAAFHYSTDGAFWKLARYFALEPGPLRIGFSAQSPTGDGCTAGFSSISLVPGTPSGLRDGG